jgi:hypothetical protein
LKQKEVHGLTDRELSVNLMELLTTDYKASKIRDHKMSDDKLRFMFEIPDKDLAISCYKDICNHNNKLKKGEKLAVPDLMIIFLQMDESVFEAYADEEKMILDQLAEFEPQSQDKMERPRKTRD